ncbi:MAG: hypothetical protein IJK46_00415 [Prevotella sp.]|nr:hypothetical protein [Prevotella sp.]
MKKYFVMVVAAMMATMNVNAQNEDLKHEIGVSYGGGISLIADGIGNAVGRGLWEGITGYEWTNDKQFGTLAVEYFYHTNDPKLAVGGIVTYSQYGEDVVKKDSRQVTGERTRRYISVMPSVKYYWVNKNHFGLYTKVAAGAMLLSEKSKDKEINKDESNSKIYFMGQLSPVGVEFGGKFRGFVEAGFGEQGIVLAGLKYKF